LFIVVGRKDEDTTGVIGSRNSKKKNSQYIGQKKNDEDTTGVIGSRNSMHTTQRKYFFNFCMF
jgi:hypothetical protein